MSTAELTTYTADDLLHLPDGDRYELVDGQLVETNMGALSSWVGGSLYAMLQSYSVNGSKGWAFPADTGLQCFPDDREKVRRPDAFFVGCGRFEDEQVPDGFVRVAPDVVAEVVFPNDQYYAVERKILEYLEAGVRLAWIVNPRQRTVMVYRGRGGDPSYLTEKDELSGEDVLPGFRVQVAALFPALQDANDRARNRSEQRLPQSRLRPATSADNARRLARISHHRGTENTETKEVTSNGYLQLVPNYVPQFVLRRPRASFSVISVPLW